MTRRERKLIQPNDKKPTTSRLIGAESTTSTSSLDPNGDGRPHSPKPSLREKSGSFLRELFGRSRNNSSTSLPDVTSDNSPSALTIAATGIQSGAALHHTLSDPIATSSQLPKIIISSPTPPEESRSVETLPSPISATAQKDQKTLNFDRNSRVEVPAVSEEVSQERSRKDILRTAYNGFQQILNIAAESSDAFPPLKSVLGGVRSVLKASETYSNNKKDLVALSSRLDLLDAMKVPENVDAKAIGRDKLLPKLQEICADLNRISQQNVIEAMANISQDERTIAGWVSDLNDLLMNYQISMQQAALGMTSEIKSELMDNDQRLQLDRLPHTKDAGFRSGNRRSCLEGTRKDVLEKIISWARDLDDKRVFWLSGNAGSGKSTIGQSFAERCSADGLLGASFFCSRDFQDRRNLDIIFPTLAFDLAYRYQSFRDALVPILKQRPNLGHESLTSQLERLLIAPLKASGVSTVIVIDAIDECKDDKSTSALLSVLERHVDGLSTAKIFITGRPESRIQSGFNLRDLKAETDVFLLHQVERTSVDDDIRLYFRSQFSELVQSRTDILFPDPWPDTASLESLVQRAGGLFIFASTTCKLLSSEYHSPLKLLQLILSSASSTGYEGQLELDALYTQILTENFKPSRSPFDVSAQVNSILGTVVVAPNPVLLETLAILLDKDVDETRPLLRSLESLIHVPALPHIPIRAFHKSFPDFLTDKSRCTELRFYVDSPQHHARLAIRCLELMQQGLKRNICDLPRYSMNKEVKDLAERRSKYIGDALEYACTSWGQHLSQASRLNGNEETLVQLMNTFMRYHLLSWLEVLSIAETLRTAVYFLRDAKTWFSQLDGNTKLVESIVDAERFVLTFFDAIEVSTSHIYESAVFLSPKNSIIRQCYNTNSRRSWNALGDSWDACIRKIDIRNGKCIAFSHNGDRVATCGGQKEESFLGIIEVATGIVMSTFSGHERAIFSVAFSPDDSLLVSGSEDCTVRLWDIKTGGLVRTLRLDNAVYSVAFSHDGSMIACNDGIWDTMLQGVVQKFGWGVRSLAWSPSKAEVALGYDSGVIKTLDVSNCTYQGLASKHKNSVRSLVYSRDGTRIASGSTDSGGEIKIHDADTGEVLQEFAASYARSVGFSHDETRLVMTNFTSMVIRDLTNWNNAAEFKQWTLTTSVSVSPDGGSVALADDSKLSIWLMNGLTLSSERASRRPRQVRCVAISPDSSFVGSGSDESTVKLWDLATGTCLHTFEGHSEYVSCISISPDSSLIASGSTDGTIRIWRIADRSPVCTLHASWITGVAFSPDGQHIASVSYGSGVTLWDIKEETTIGKSEGTGFSTNQDIRIRFSDDTTNLTVFTNEKVKSWTMMKSSAPPADPGQLPISFIPRDHTLENQSYLLHDLTRKKSWITDQNGVRVCWLPRDLYHTWDLAFDCKGSKIAMGLENGRVFWFDFGPSELVSND